MIYDHPFIYHIQYKYLGGVDILGDETLVID